MLIRHRCALCHKIFTRIFYPSINNVHVYCSYACYWGSIKPRPLLQVLQHFWSKVTVCAHAPYCLFCCWLWQGNDAQGYGKIYVNRRRVHVHRFSWAWHNYPERIPDDYGPIIRHTCHQTNCVNPAHLVSGDQSLNAWDTLLSGRSLHNKLTIQDVRTIRQLRQKGQTYKAIAALYPVQWSAIKAICLRQTWKHLP